MKTADFDFTLPKELIALHPSKERDRSRLLVLHRGSGAREHKRFFEIETSLGQGDLLLLNDTRVVPARIVGATPSGRSLDLLLVKETPRQGVWEVLLRGGYEGSIELFGGMVAEVWSERSEAPEAPPRRFLKFPDLDAAALRELLWQWGQMPLPPYIRRQPDAEDRQRYQTVYARQEGSIAAPTAGLHFTEDLLSRLRAKGVAVRTITLHVGPGTFKPVKAELVADHTMDAEYVEIAPALLEEIERTRQAGGRLITVGTTATRAIEGWLSGSFLPSGGDNGALRGYSTAFIYPGYSFRAVDGLLTNFHLPRSTPLLLVSAFAGIEIIRKVYEEAVAEGYRFFSYGDAMLIL